MAAIAGDGARNRIPRLNLSVSKSKDESSYHVSRAAKALVVTSLGLAMAGRGYSAGDRAASGGLIGGGIGAVGDAMTSGNRYQPGSSDLALMPMQASAILADIHSAA
jgi:hypothetical protein